MNYLSHKIKSMKILVFILMFISALGIAQEKVTMNLGDFHSLKTYRGLQVELIKADAAQLVIDGKRSSEVTVKNNNGTLKISMSISHTFSADDVMVYLYYKDNIDVIDANAVIHWFRADRPGQHRGVPEITPALPLFAQLRRYTLAVLGAAGLVAMCTAVGRQRP